MQIHNIDLKKEYYNEIVKILNLSFPNSEIWAYGSRINGNSHPGSDLDLVIFEENCPANKIQSLKTAFTKSNLPILVQVSLWSNLPDSFKEEINKKYYIIKK